LLSGIFVAAVMVITRLLKRISVSEPDGWVAARQDAGRLVSITNDKIFNDPVYNYTEEFPHIWEEMQLPIPYNGQTERAEQIILAARQRATEIAELSEARSIGSSLSCGSSPEDHGIRGLQDAMSRDILREFHRAGIGIASGAYEVVSDSRK
jgi:small-conductance mechanosensitive channel